MTEAAARKLALSFPESEEKPHFDRAAFKITGKRGRIFCTLGDGTVNLKVEPRARLYQLLKDRPDVFLDLGGWTRMGFCGIKLSKVKEPELRQLMTEAWERVAPKRLVSDGGA